MSSKYIFIKPSSNSSIQASIIWFHLANDMIMSTQHRQNSGTEKTQQFKTNKENQNPSFGPFHKNPCTKKQLPECYNTVKEFLISKFHQHLHKQFLIVDVAVHPKQNIGKPNE